MSKVCRIFGKLLADKTKSFPKRKAEVGHKTGRMKKIIEKKRPFGKDFLPLQPEFFGFIQERTKEKAE